MTFAPAANSIRWLSFRNDTGEPIPPFAVLRPTGVVTVQGQAVLTVARPNADGGSFYFFNGPFAVDAGGFGSCTGDFPCFAAYDTADVPALGQQWGAKNGSWLLEKGHTGYKIIGGAIDGRVEIISTQSPSNLTRFYLNGDLARGESASAQVLEWDGALWQPGSETIEVFDSSKIGPAKAAGVGVCYLSPESQRYEIITLEESANQFEMIYLNANLPLSGSASAQIEEWNGSLWLPNSDPAITVVDSRRLGPAKATDVGIAWHNPHSNRYELVTLQRRPDEVRWAVATAKWTNQPGNDSYVVCHKAIDRAGTPLLEGDPPDFVEVIVYLPRPRDGFADPNVRDGDTIGYQIDEDGDAICVTDYLDDPIGTVKMWSGAEEDVRGGWRILAVSEGRFPVGVTTSDPDIPATAPGTIGGLKKHYHKYRQTGVKTDPTELTIEDHPSFYTAGKSLSIPPVDTVVTSNVSLSIGAAGDTTATGTITGSGTIPTTAVAQETSVLEHADHYHTVYTSPGAPYNVGATYVPAEPLTYGTSGHIDIGTGATGPQYHQVINPQHSHQVNASQIAQNLSIGNITIPGHTHEIAPNPHYHFVTLPTLTISPNPHDHGVPSLSHVLNPNPHRHDLPDSPEERHIPPFFGIYFIERFE
jgi:hypothetical protein